MYSWCLEGVKKKRSVEAIWCVCVSVFPFTFSLFLLTASGGSSGKPCMCTNTIIASSSSSSLQVTGEGVGGGREQEGNGVAGLDMCPRTPFWGRGSPKHFTKEPASITEISVGSLLTLKYVSGAASSVLSEHRVLALYSYKCVW